MKREYQISVAECTDHDETFGPAHADDVSYWVMDGHRDCDVNMINWTEEEIVQCAKCESEATHFEEREFMGLGTQTVAFCNDCGDHEVEE